VPRDIQEGDLISQFIGCSIPSVLRLPRDEKPKVRESARWGKLLDSVRWSATSELSLESIDLQIKRALEETTTWNEGAKVLHCHLVGECFVDGLMQRGLGVVAGEKSKLSRVVLALH